jgi:hypothetical protein
MTDSPFPPSNVPLPALPPHLRRYAWPASELARKGAPKPISKKLINLFVIPRPKIYAILASLKPPSPDPELVTIRKEIRALRKGNRARMKAYEAWRSGTGPLPVVPQASEIK